MKSYRRRALRQSIRIKFRLNRTALVLSLGALFGISMFIYLNMGETEVSKAHNEEYNLMTDAEAQTEFEVQQPVIQPSSQRYITSNSELQKPNVRKVKPIPDN